MIRSVRGHVTVHAAHAVRIANAVIARQVDVPPVGMTLQTQKRIFGHQQVPVGRPMRRVAIHAAFANRRVLPQKWSALLGVARDTGFIDRVLDQKPGS